ncbi:MAG: oligosaccharide flippase family protein [Acidobacteriaceae bacterium]
MNKAESSPDSADARWKLAKNSAANFARGGAAAVAALVLPPILIRHMGKVEFGIWALILQIAAYVGYLDFGLQAAVGRYVAFTTEKRDLKARDAIYTTALTGLSIAALLGFLLISLAAIAAHRFFQSVPNELIGPMRSATVIVGLSMSLGLPASACNGVFVGLQRYEIPALTVGGAKLISALGLIIAAIEGKSLVTMAVILAGVNIASYIVQADILRRILPDLRFRLSLISRATVRELSGYCFSLTVWSLSMLLVNGFDLILVGRFQFSAVAPYAVAAMLVTFLAGAQNAVFGVIMPHAATLQARENREGLGKLLISSTRLGTLLLLASGLPLIVFAFEILKLWIGPNIAESGQSLLVILLIANIVRLIGAPYASILVGTGQQKLVIVSPIMEGVCNLVLSILLGMRYGAIGVAWGTLAGATVGMLSQIVYNVKRTEPTIQVSRRKYLVAGVLIPVLCGSPVYCTFWLSKSLSRIPAHMLIAALAVSLCACMLLAAKTISVRTASYL